MDRGNQPHQRLFAYFGFLDKQPIPKRWPRGWAMRFLRDFEARGMKPRSSPARTRRRCASPSDRTKSPDRGRDRLGAGGDAEVLGMGRQTPLLAKIKAEITKAYAALPYVAPKNETLDGVAAGSPPQQASNPMIGRLHKNRLTPSRSRSQRSGTARPSTSFAESRMPTGGSFILGLGIFRMSCDGCLRSDELEQAIF